MANESDIALAIIEGSIVALPLWLAVVRWVTTDVEGTRSDETTTKWDEWFTVIVHPALVAIAFWAIFGAFTSSIVVAWKGSGDLTISVFMLLVFFFIVGMQAMTVLIGEISRIGYGKKGEIVGYVGLFAGSVVLLFIMGLI